MTMGWEIEKRKLHQPMHQKKKGKIENNTMLSY
jgi:hypothetical protein